ncbi:MAG TPA: hypothetical protein DCO71_05000 [Gammaproteobacteria bacterium]|nr:hypothetical protein [Gammaproteobacteria bacterium]
MQTPQEEEAHDNTLPPAELDSAALTITDTCLTEARLLVAFNLNGDSHYVSTVLSAPEQEIGTVILKVPAPYRVMTALQAEDWPATEQCSRLPDVMGTWRWNELLYRTLVSLAPADCHCGVVVDILRHHELFVYYDDRGILNSVPIEHKPDSVRTVESFDCDELLTRMGQVLRELLAESGDPDRSVVFETGDSAAWGYPLVYADGSNGTVLPMQYNQTAPGGFATSGIVQTTRTVSHAITGQVHSFVAHPLSSLTRLFTLLGTTVADVLYPTPLLILQGTPIPPLNTGPGMDLQEWELELDRMTGTTASKGKLVFHVDGKKFFPRLVDLINQAQQSVFLRLYIFDNDDYATWFADFLKQRSEAVDIRVIIDGLGTIGASAATPETLPEDHSAPMSIKHYLQADSRVKVHMLNNPWFTGDHTKSIIIDKKVAFIGGMNIGREYRYNWHDLMTEVEGPVVNDILYEFEKTWTTGSFMGGVRTLFWQKKPPEHVDDGENYPVRVLYTKPGKSQILHAQVKAIRQARHQILLENAYLTSDRIIYELARARRRGVDVRVIIPYEIDYNIINRSNIIAANAMLKNGVRVYIYPGMSHVKAAIYDGWACLGSANFDNLSLRINKELNLATSATDAVNALKEQVFLPDMERSVELTEPLPDNWLDHLAELLADSM